MAQLIDFEYSDEKLIGVTVDDDGDIASFVREDKSVRGIYFRTGKLHKDRVCVYTTQHRYENEGEQPYVKHGCPVCEQIGAKHSLEYGIPQCPLCGVNLMWRVGDNGSGYHTLVPNKRQI